MIGRTIYKLLTINLIGFVLFCVNLIPLNACSCAYIPRFSYYPKSLRIATDAEIFVFFPHNITSNWPIRPRIRSINAEELPLWLELDGNKQQVLNKRFNPFKRQNFQAGEMRVIRLSLTAKFKPGTKLNLYTYANLKGGRKRYLRSFLLTKYEYGPQKPALFDRSKSNFTTEYGSCGLYRGTYIQLKSSKNENRLFAVSISRFSNKLRQQKKPDTIIRSRGSGIFLGNPAFCGKSNLEYPLTLGGSSLYSWYMKVYEILPSKKIGPTIYLKWKPRMGNSLQWLPK
ncbi:MAG: hypothetical protein AAF518_18965 [Spirochaetota bacterium]